jgi:hypothetical protein
MALTEQQFQKAANLIKADVAAVKAVNEVESSGNGFLKDGRPKILFEGHIFWKQLLRKGIDPKKKQKNNEDVLFPVWDKTRYLGKEAEYTRLEKAKKIDESAALESASYGAFQIMGYHFKRCGFNSVKDFVDAQLSEEQQLAAFICFIKDQHLDLNLRLHDWAGFALGYNGRGYHLNQYDTKLLKAYNKFAALPN